MNPLDNRHPRESGGPGQATEQRPLDSRFRGNDDIVEPDHSLDQGRAPADLRLGGETTDNLRLRYGLKF